MNKSRLIVLALALMAGVGAIFIAKTFMTKPVEVVEKKTTTIEVLAASKDIQMGDKLETGSLQWIAWPESNVVRETMITQTDQPNAKEELASARARGPIFMGELINAKKYIQPQDAGFMSAILPKGMRAISVAISERSGAGGFILPNDRVDLILTRKLDIPNTAVKVVKSETILRNVRVLAINQTFTKKQEKGEDQVTVTEGKTATLELDPRQVEIVSMVESSGELSLALRSVAENDGKKLNDTMPEVASSFDPSGRGGGQGDNISILRYGIENYAANR